VRPAIPNKSHATPRRKAFQVDFVESFILAEEQQNTTESHQATPPCHPQSSSSRSTLGFPRSARDMTSLLRQQT
jgi:hypothetical protein